MTRFSLASYIGSVVVVILVVAILVALSWTKDQSILTLTADGDPVTCAAFSPDGVWLASGGHDNAVRIWKVGDWKESQILQGHRSAVQAVVFHADGGNVTSADENGTLITWDVKTGEQVRRIQTPHGCVGYLGFSPNCKKLAVVHLSNSTVSLRGST